MFPRSSCSSLYNPHKGLSCMFFRIPLLKRALSFSAYAVKRSRLVCSGFIEHVSWQEFLWYIARVRRKKEEVYSPMFLVGYLFPVCCSCCSYASRTGLTIVEYLPLPHFRCEQISRLGIPCLKALITLFLSSSETVRNKGSGGVI